MSVAALDGAFFGTSFAHLFFITFDRLVPDPARATYTPLIFGFKIHKCGAPGERVERYPFIVSCLWFCSLMFGFKIRMCGPSAVEIVVAVCCLSFLWLLLVAGCEVQQPAR